MTKGMDLSQLTSTSSFDQQLRLMQREIDSVQICLNRLRQMSVDVNSKIHSTGTSAPTTSVINVNQLHQKQQTITTTLTPSQPKGHSHGRPPRSAAGNHSSQSHPRNSTHQRPKLNFIQQPQHQPQLGLEVSRSTNIPKSPYDSFYSKDLLREESEGDDNEGIKRNDNEDDSNMINFDDHTSHVSMLTTEFSLRPGNFHDHDDDNTTISGNGHVHDNHHDFGMDQQHGLGLGLAPPSASTSISCDWKSPTPQRSGRKSTRTTFSRSMHDIHQVDVDIFKVSDDSIYDVQSFNTIGRREITRNPIPERTRKRTPSKMKRKMVKTGKRIGRLFSRRQKK